MTSVASGIPVAPVLLRGARLVDPAVGRDEVADILIEGGRIANIGPDLGSAADAHGQDGAPIVVECAGKIAAPGLVDIHVHLREPGREDKETVATGTRAAAHGGFTGIAAMPNTSPVCDTGSKARFLRERAAAEGLVRVYPIGACTVGSKGEALAEMGDMLAEGAVAFSDDGHGVQSAGMTRLVMDYAKQFGATVISHCEDEGLVGRGVVNEGSASTRLGLPGWPAAAEEIHAARDIRLAELTGCRLHLAHLSTAGSVGLVRAAKKRGISVTCEVTPHHLFLDEGALGDAYDTNLKMNPPLRTAADREALVAALLDGTVDCIASDHAPHAPHEKALEFELAPFGTTGLETALPLMVTNLIGSSSCGTAGSLGGSNLPGSAGRLDWGTLVQLMAHGPRKVLGLSPVHLEKGAVADITVIDPEAEVPVVPEFFESRSANSAFLGTTLSGKATEVLVGGRFALRNGKVVGT
ncbi:MAG: dihydroorotase [Coriobacteriia bacterium]|nr:dihydroorotase [Coriobacteriia bacterium]